MLVQKQSDVVITVSQCHLRILNDNVFGCLVVKCAPPVKILLRVRNLSKKSDQRTLTREESHHLPHHDHSSWMPCERFKHTLLRTSVSS